MRSFRVAVAAALLAMTACASPASDEGGTATLGEDALVAGKLDATFGAAGILTLKAFPDTRFDSILEQKTGALVIAGRVYGADRRPAGLRLVRLGADGALDPGFGNGGTTIIPAAKVGGENAEGVALEVMADDRIVISGFAFVTRVTAAGALDVSFGDGGSVDVTKVVSSPKFQARGSIQARVSGDAVFLSVWAQSNGVVPDAAIVKLDAKGALDTAYGVAGLARLTTAFREFLVDAEGRVLVSSEGTEVEPITAARRTSTPVLRLDARGAPDTTFGPKGVIWVETGDRGFEMNPKAASGGVVYAESSSGVRIAFRLDGTVVSAPRATRRPREAFEWQADGKRVTATHSGSDAALVMRDLQDGSDVDRSFAQHGEAFVRFPSRVGAIERVRTVGKGSRLVVLTNDGYPGGAWTTYLARFR